MSIIREIELLPSASRTATGEGDEKTFDQSAKQDNMGAKFYLSVSAVTGTSPTLDVTITKTLGGVDFTIGTFQQITASGQEVIDVSNCPDKVKAKYTIAGDTPDFTFQVWGTR